MLLLSVCFAAGRSSAAQYGAQDLHWAVPCDKYRLCRTILQQGAGDAASCALNPRCRAPAPFDCFASDALFLPFRCALAECLEVSALATSASQCAVWFPPLALETRRRLKVALDEAKALKVNNATAPALVAAVADFDAAAGKGSKKSKKGNRV